MTPRKPLCCVLCDERCYQVRSETIGGAPRNTAKCIEGSRQVTLVMRSGSTAQITVCSRCEVGAENLMHVWRRCTIGPMRERRVMSAKELLRQHRDVPIGVLKVRPHTHWAVAEGTLG